MTIDTTGTFRIQFLTEVVPEDEDTVEGLCYYVADIAANWLPDQFIFDVYYETLDGKWVLGASRPRKEK